jgi:hypothetical protein
LIEWPQPRCVIWVTRLRRDATSIACSANMSRRLKSRISPAFSAAQSALEDSQATGHSLSLCNALVHTACPIALWVGDLPSAERFLAMLRDHLAKHRMTVMNPLCSCLEGVLLVNQGNFTGLELIQTALNELRETRFHMCFPAYLAALAHGLSANGQVTEARITIEEALKHLAAAANLL